MRRALVIVGLVVAGLLGASSFAIWDDGRKFAAVTPTTPAAPEGPSEPSYLESRKFHWRTATKLDEYARKHRERILEELDEDSR